MKNQSVVRYRTFQLRLAQPLAKRLARRNLVEQIAEQVGLNDRELELLAVPHDGSQELQPRPEAGRVRRLCGAVALQVEEEALHEAVAA